MNSRLRTLLLIGFSILLLVLALSALHHLTAEVRGRDLRQALRGIPASHLLLAACFTALSYFTLTFYDRAALHIIGVRLPWRTSSLASFTSYTLSHNLGLSVLTGGSARYRVYTRAGLDGADVARIIAIAGGAFWLGVFTIGGIALILHPGPVGVGQHRLAPAAAHFAGWAIIALILSLLAVAASPVRTVRILRWEIPLPGLPDALRLLLVASVDLAAASLALFVLVPGVHAGMWPAFLFAYVLAIVAGLISHVPGGLGVFEAVVISMLPIDNTPLFAALIAYRIIYYLVPLAIAITLLAISEGRALRDRAARTIDAAGRVAGSIAPMLMSTAAFLSGAVLLVSGALPADRPALQRLHHILPLPFIEASHIAASLVGTLLLLLAPGLYRRLDGAFLATRALLLAGGVFSLLKGADIPEAMLCFLLAALLQWVRPAFYRRTELTMRPMSPVWLLCVATVVILSLWVGFVSYRHVEYRQDLWWQIAIGGDASRFMRASLAVAMALGAAAVWRLLSPGHARRGDTPPAPSQVPAILARATSTDAMLALTGDKKFLLSTDGDCFLMYGVRGATWVVMGDPVGPRDRWDDLLWEIRHRADAAQGRLLLYQIDTQCLEPAIELGLDLVKYGEEAIVDLAGFSLEGSAMRTLRQTVRKLEREGARFSIVPVADVPAIMPELATVSDQWLAAKDQKEKGFSLGRFDPAYMAMFDCATVRRDGRIVAFANIWRTGDGSEISIDLMRHADDAPAGAMDYLFVQLMLWGAERGFRRFSLGLAPLSGIEGRRLAPAWAKAAALLFQHGERFYGFRGLRAYKEKFRPRWEPRFIAGPRGVGLVQALIDLNALIADAPEEASFFTAGPDAAFRVEPAAAPA